ncbi:hypothetical protein BM525_20750 (plasmid) [Alteromonas mediterranea]|uniref:Uncharacterized protein n=1 Tax=Alteromonas mediterranea TaxID=314275 RepID=A0AAC9JE06_9ALTE|nr:hypothetical protein [Alteromonas mediterranea]APD92294.1 hypothetical protein BM524_20525 [Alteromonas mediterranea]APE00155.1 hypothetical protein BM525_20750 [Alteromonas mediterranea]
MNKLKLNKLDIKVIREALKLPFFELVSVMGSKGWDVKIVAEDPKSDDGWVCFTKEKEWNGRPTLANTPTFSYRFDKSSDVALDAAAQRAAELALTVYEMFGRYLPTSPNINGDIHACSITNQDKYLQTNYDEWIAGHKDKKLHLLPSSLTYNGNVHIDFWGRRLQIGDSEVTKFMNDIDAIVKKLDGTYAFN